MISRFNMMSDREEYYMKLFDRVMSVIGTNSTDKKKSLEVFEFEAAGSYYYLDNIGKLACKNPEYGKKASKTYNGRIYRYNYINKPVKLIPDPQNKHDKNAVMVIIAGELVGYVPSGMCKQVKNILKGEVKYISSFIGGGQYKQIESGQIILRGEYGIKVNVKIGYVK